MSDSTSLLDLLTTNSQQEPNANALYDAASNATLLGRREKTTSGLVWGYYGGNALTAGNPTTIANGTITLSASSTNYIEVDNTGIVVKNTSGFTPGRIPLYTVTTGPSTISFWTDERCLVAPFNPRISIAMTDANKTLTQVQSAADIIEITGTITADRQIIVPLPAKQWVVANLTTGGFNLVFIGGSGTGVTVANGKRAVIYSDGTNVVRATADV